MIKIVILKSLRDKIYKTFKHDSVKIYRLFEALKKNPSKGKVLGHVGSMSIRELKYQTFRFYYIVDGHKLSIHSLDSLEKLLVKFVAMSKKHDQQDTIDRIKALLKRLKE